MRASGSAFARTADDRFCMQSMVRYVSSCTMRKKCSAWVQGVVAQRARQPLECRRWRLVAPCTTSIYASAMRVRALKGCLHATNRRLRSSRSRCFGSCDRTFRCRRIRSPTASGRFGHGDDKRESDVPSGECDRGDHIRGAHIRGDRNSDWNHKRTVGCRGCADDDSGIRWYASCGGRHGRGDLRGKTSRPRSAR
jgi:hypothetical protein